MKLEKKKKNLHISIIMSIFAKRNHQNIKIMTKEELIDRINDIEWEDFEAKEAKSELPKNIWETVSAFANTSGGWIVLGIKQNGKKFEISGVDNAEKLEQDFQGTLRSQKFNEAVDAKSMLYHIDGHRFFWMDLVDIPGRSVREARTRYTYRIPEQENLWEYFQIMIRRLRLIVDTPFMMNDEGFNVEDRSQFKILREALVNMLSHFDPFSTIHSCINIYTNRVNDRVINNNEIYDILNFCREPKTRREIFECIGLVYHSDAFKAHIKPLIDFGYLALTIPDKPNSRLQKYKLTEKGKGLLVSLKIGTTRLTKLLNEEKSNYVCNHVTTKKK